MDSPFPRSAIHAVVALCRRGIRWLPVVGLGIYVALLAHVMGACAGGSDSSGYLNNARLLATGRVTAPMRLLPGVDPAALPDYTHVPLGFIPNQDHRSLTPTYPLGLSLINLALARLCGWDIAPGLMMGLHGLLGLWIMYHLGRRVGLDASWAGVGALILAASPLYLLMAQQAMSDVPAMVWVSGAVLLAWESRERTWLAAAAGMALAVAVLVRPTNLLALLPTLVAMGWSPRRWLLLLWGGMPGAVFLAAFNHAAYGRILTTGYGAVGAVIETDLVGITLAHYGRWLPVLLTPVVLLAAGLPARWRRDRPIVVLLTAWAVPLLVFYLFYFHTHEDWCYLRFLLPAFPPLIAASMLTVQTLVGRYPAGWRPWLAAILGTAIIIHGGTWSRRLHAFTAGRGELVYPETAAWVRSHLPPNAVVAAMQTSGALFYYTNYTLFRWDQIQPEQFSAIVRSCQAAGRPLYAVLFPYEIDEWKVFHGHLDGRWTQIGSVRHVSIWRFDSHDR